MSIDKLLSIPKSFFVSLHFFPLKDALKLPVLVRYNAKIMSLRGAISIGGGKIRRAMLSIGFGKVGLYDKKYQRCILQIDGTIKLQGDSKVTFGHGSRISIGEGGCVEFGRNFSNTAQMNLCCVERITFGNDVVSSWDTLVMDTDWHCTCDTQTDNVNPCTKSIVIGNGVWLCTRSLVLKGAYIPNGCIVGANSLVAKRYEEENCVIAGNPASVRKRNVTLKRN